MDRTRLRDIAENLIACGGASTSCYDVLELAQAWLENETSIAVGRYALDGVSALGEAEAAGAELPLSDNPGKALNAYITVYQKLTDELKQLRRLRDAIEELRKDEGDSVSLHCDNPDFEGPDNAIDCSGEWTGYREERFTGTGLLHTLEQAVKARRERSTA